MRSSESDRYESGFHEIVHSYGRCTREHMEHSLRRALTRLFSLQYHKDCLRDLQEDTCSCSAHAAVPDVALGDHPGPLAHAKDAVLVQRSMTCSLAEVRYLLRQNYVCTVPTGTIFEAFSNLSIN